MVDLLVFELEGTLGRGFDSRSAQAEVGLCSDASQPSMDQMDRQLADCFKTAKNYQFEAKHVHCGTEYWLHKMRMNDIAWHAAAIYVNCALPHDIEHRSLQT
eukprot:scaffold67978_cov33-Prasinocladus_malaysianus.AAC.1